MTRMPGPLNIVLDDMESLAPDAPSLALIQTLVAESPRHVRFFLLSRTRLRLNLSRFKMNQELLELGNQELPLPLRRSRHFLLKPHNQNPDRLTWKMHKK